MTHRSSFSPHWRKEKNCYFFATPSETDTDSKHLTVLQSEKPNHVDYTVSSLGAPKFIVFGQFFEELKIERKSNLENTIYRDFWIKVKVIGRHLENYCGTYGRFIVIYLAWSFIESIAFIDLGYVVQLVVDPIVCKRLQRLPCPFFLALIKAKGPYKVLITSRNILLCIFSLSTRLQSIYCLDYFNLSTLHAESTTTGHHYSIYLIAFIRLEERGGIEVHLKSK